MVEGSKKALRRYVTHHCQGDKYSANNGQCKEGLPLLKSGLQTTKNVKQ